MTACVMNKGGRTSVVILFVMACCFPFLFGGCTARRAVETADTEVTGIIDEKFGSISGEAMPEDAGYPAGMHPGDAGPLEISLNEAVSLAMENNRTYRSRREDVYLQVLDLTYRRYLFGTRYRASGTAGWERDAEGEQTLSGRFGLGLVRVLATGAEVSFDVAQDFLRYLTGDRERDLQTIIRLNLLQPVLRGAGREIALENLLQAERDAVYAIRSFLRYQKDFYVEATGRYLDILLLKSRMDNFHANYESLKRTRERVEMLAEAGRLPPMQVDQARQNEFNARQRWITSMNRYEAELDNFKVFLALSPDAEILLDKDMLDRLIEEGVESAGLDLEEFIRTALEKRLDLITRFNRLEDARRKAVVAADGLRTGLDLRAGTRAATEKDSSLSLDFGNPSYSAALELEVPVDRMSERNQYVRAVMNIGRMEREFRDKLATVRLEVARQHRNLEEAFQSYIIQRQSMELGRQRIESTGLLLEAGRATTRDLLEAEEAYLAAQNELAAEIIKHEMAYLRFLYFAELLEVDEEGRWRRGIYEKDAEEHIHG